MQAKKMSVDSVTSFRSHHQFNICNINKNLIVSFSIINEIRYSKLLIFDIKIYVEKKKAKRNMRHKW